FVLPSIEIVDSRFNKRGPNGLIDSISDAASCGLIVLAGNPRKLTDLDIRAVGASMTINGVIEESGVARAVMDNPVSSVAWLINKLAEFGVTPQPGHIILSGSFLKATPFNPGDNVQALFSHDLGEVGFTCV
ncbi:MAG: 2-keto-4-pentenoate hydratase, partial [Acidimicrobiia bacterium]